MFRKRMLYAALSCAVTWLSCASPTRVDARDVVVAPTIAAAQTYSVPMAVPQITRAIDLSKMLPMQTNVPFEANAANDAGAVDDDYPMDNMFLLLHRPDAQEQALETFIEEQTTFGSPNYHHWLTAEQVGEYGPAQSDVDTITAWLELQGFSINRVHADRMMIDFSGTVGQVRQTFNTQIHSLIVDGQPHISNMTVPQLPAALEPAVVGVVSLNDFAPHTNIKPKPAYTFSGNTGTHHALVPADLATIYNLNPLFNAGIDGTGQTIVLLEQQNPYNSVSGVNADINTFRSKFGLPAFGTGPTYKEVHPGGCFDPGNSNDGTDSEVELDIEWAGAAAPHASLVMASCANTSTYGIIVAMQNLNSANDPARLWSISYGLCEARGGTYNAAFSTTYQTAAARGVSVFVASGDEGAASCDANKTTATHGIGVSGWTSTAYNVSVGGTDFGESYAGTAGNYWNTTNTTTFGSAKSYINEIPWNNSCASALISSAEGFGTTYGTSGFCNSSAATSNNAFLSTGSGSGGPSGCATGTPSTSMVVSGSCAGRAKPSWQSGFLGNPADGVRDIPDVSLFAANGVWGHYYVFCWSNPAPAGAGGASCSGAPNTWSGAGGTSFGSPIMAGIQALVNQKTQSSQGNPNPTYYALAAAEYGTSGSSTCNSTLGSSVSSSCIFYDVRQGDMDVNCTGSFNCYLPSGTNGVLSTSNSAYQPSYGADTGWDFATGLGTINAANLVNGWPLSSTQMIFSAQPGSTYGSGATFSVSVSIENSSGSVVTADTSAVTLALTTASGATLSGTKTVNAIAGVATFSNLSVDKIGSYTLTATDGSLTSATSNAFAIKVGDAKTVTFTTQPSSSANVASGVTIPLVAHVVDTGGNAVSGQNITLSIGNNAGSSTMSVTTNPVSTNSVGDATFAGVSLNKIGTGYTLVAANSTTPAASAATSNAFNIVAGAPASVSFTTQPSSAVIGADINPAIVVHVQDASGNAIASDGITLAIQNNPAGSTLTGGGAVSTNASGNATFSAIALDKTGAGFTLKASDSSGTPLTSTSNAFDITAANQTVSFVSTAPAHAVVDGSTYSVSATATSGLAAALTIGASSTDVCTIAGSTVSFNSAGTCVIDANQAGNANYNAATQVQQSFAVGKGSQTILFTSTAPSAAGTGGTYAVTAMGGASVSPVTFKIDASAASVCSIIGSTVSFIGIGTCLIDADQAGDANYSAASQAHQSFAVGIGPAATLVFTVQPSSLLAGKATTATVSIEDGFGNVETNDNTTQVIISVNACGDVPLATITVNGGVAQFSNLVFYSVANSLQLHAISNPVLASADSGTFNVSANGDYLLHNGFEGCVP
jgi:Pro-kumamolisin, activation domain